MRVLVLTLFVLIARLAAAQAVIVVPTDHATIQGAILAAGHGDTILVQPGIYLERDIDFYGRAVRVVSAAGPTATIVDAQGLGRGFIFRFNEGPGSILEGFAILNGKAPNGLLPNKPVGEDGGGILCQGASPLIRDCAIGSSVAGNGAGAATILGAGFRGGQGGALAVLGGAPTLIGCAFVDGHGGRGGSGVGGAGQGGGGGGIFISGNASPVFLDCFVSGCVGGEGGGTGSGAGTPGSPGGGVLVQNATARFIGSVLANNVSGRGGDAPGAIAGSGGIGGGVAAVSSDLRFARCRIVGNNGNFGGLGSGASGGAGAGLHLMASTARFEGCELAANRVYTGSPSSTPVDGADGGGIRAVGSTVDLVNCIVRDNEAGAAPAGGANTGGDGGGIAAHDSIVKLIHTTFSRNRTGAGATVGTGGALHLTGTSTADIANSILYNDVPNEIADPVGGATVSFSDVKGGIPGFGNTDVNPLFIAPAQGNLHLSAQSPAIDAGNAGLPGRPTVDYDGDERATIPDLGADEVPSIGLFPGSGGDLRLRTLVNERGHPDAAVKTISAGDVIRATYDSPLGTLVGNPGLLGFQLYATGLPPATPTGFPEVFLNPGVSPAPLVTTVTNLGPPGRTFAVALLPGFAGSSFRTQAFVVTPTAANGLFAASDAHEIHIVTAPTPTLTSVHPTGGPAETPVTVFGAGFSAGTRITFGGTPVLTTLIAPGILGCAVPSGAGCGTALAVVNPDGQSATALFNEAPVITSTLDAIGATTGGVTFTMLGSGLGPGTTVTIDGNPALVTLATGTTLAVSTPPGAIGTVAVIVAAPAGCTTSTTYTYAVIAPTITAVTPSVAAPGSTITVHGNFFLQGLTLTIGGASVPITSVTSTQVVFANPSGIPCNSTLTVTNPGGQAASTPFNQSPTVLTMFLVGGSGGPFLFLSGSGLVPGATVQIGGVAATVTNATGGQLTAAIPAGVSGTAMVIVTAPNGCSTTTTFVFP